ncbi:ABC transporter ATP-binding protein [Mesorhizobium retamae]|uniref:ABC transporter ATP-binding protein n=1 Tax=Mesorhizobium retamae TaxID=2912854 RepID=A0ABS9QD98_9HYPH|nr:ABC transporter ATP-binding protein [Mesorhizobium sp. IRAMC:0171]MCG7505387.1 ABC transporter ATP-binding protein [Mesorhizobium sp. IRAMC:0171]
MTKPLLEVRRLTIEAFQPETGWRKVVHDVSFDVFPGEVVALIGESGGGKTTIGLTALGYVRPGMRLAGGKVLFNGENILSFSQERLRLFRGASVAYVAQSASAALNPSITIGNQISEGIVQHGLMSAADAKRRTLELLKALSLPDPPHLAMRYPQETSGGQQQRVMTAMSLSCGPRLLVLDEPTTALDVTTQMQVLKTIKDALKEFDASAIYVSHDLAVVSQIATRILVLRNGRIVEAGDTFDVLERPSHEYTRALRAAVRKLPHVEDLPQQRTVARSEPSVSVKNVRATYDNPSIFRRGPAPADVLHGVSLDVYPGEVLAVVGESGSGKSTLARVIAGLHSAREGKVLFRGQAVSSRASRRSKECLKSVQIVFQSPEQALNPRATVAQAIGRPLAFYFGMSRSDRRRRVEELLEMVGIPPEYADKYPKEMSGGERQRVAIARALAAEPSVIICDEFLSALDTIVAAQIVDLMKSLRDRLGTAYIFISHDLATVADIADRVAVMQHGRVVELAAIGEVFGARRHQYTAELIRSVPEMRLGWLESALSGVAGT